MNVFVFGLTVCILEWNSRILCYVCNFICGGISDKTCSASLVSAVSFRSTRTVYSATSHVWSQLLIKVMEK